MTDLRRCIGSTKFGIEAHEAPPEDFPAQPSQKDGLGRMCKPHWNQYTTALRKASLARKDAEVTPAEPPATPARVSNQQRRAAAQAAGKVPAADGSVPKEKPTRPAPAQHVELLDPPVGRQRRKAPVAAEGATTA